MDEIVGREGRSCGTERPLSLESPTTDGNIFVTPFRPLGYQSKTLMGIDPGCLRIVSINVEQKRLSWEWLWPDGLATLGGNAPCRFSTFRRRLELDDRIRFDQEIICV